MLKSVVVLLFVIALLATGTMGQSTFGELIGVVKDPGQGLIPSAAVTLTSVEEENEYSAVSDADGLFHFVNLKPGHYNLIVRAVGFADYRVSSLQLEARQSLRFGILRSTNFISVLPM